MHVVALSNHRHMMMNLDFSVLAMDFVSMEGDWDRIFSEKRWHRPIRLSSCRDDFSELFNIRFDYPFRVESH